jgi:hypothetical protein
MKLTGSTLWRSLCLSAVVFLNYPTQKVDAASQCWDCTWCSNGYTCCPMGTRWSTCTPGSSGLTCWVTRGDCAGS